MLILCCFATSARESSPAQALIDKDYAKVNVAVSANFFDSLKHFKADIETLCVCKLGLTAGASGVLAAQFDRGAPYDVFFSADSEKPQWLFERGKTKSKPVTYAIGQLVLLDNQRKTVSLDALGQSSTEHEAMRIAIANPKTAPYGVAAKQILDKVVREDAFEVVYGQSVMQTLQFLQTGSVDQALVARSLLAKVNLTQVGVAYIDDSLHTSIIQQVVINKRSYTKKAQCVVDFFGLENTKNTLTEMGYKISNKHRISGL